MKKDVNMKKVFVGISGGVDSSVAAHLLKKEGYEVHGVFIKTWSPDWLACTWQDEKRDAMRVCAALGIPFHFLDAEEVYKQEVANYMIEEYKAGRTPNPDVLCNRVIKFGVFWDYAHNCGADFIATGHYVQTDTVKLYKGIDHEKDQAYFLWMLTKDDLAHCLFPIGKYKKSEVRQLAKKAKLLTAAKKDSQGICFLGDVDMHEFLTHYIDQKPGAVVDTEGVIIGVHTGVWFYTLGERHGFTITKKDANRKPYYVVGKNIEKNELIVNTTPTRIVEEGQQRLRLRMVNWLSAQEARSVCDAQIRYHGAVISAKIISECEVELATDSVISPGQSIVFYKDAELIGGGIIDSVK